MTGSTKGKSDGAFTKFKFDWLRRVAADADVARAGYRVAILIAQYLNRQSGECYPSVDRMTADLSCVENTIRTGLQSLEARAHLKVKWSKGGNKRPNHYWPLIDGKPFKPLRGFDESETPQISDVEPLRHLGSIESDRTPQTSEGEPLVDTNQTGDLTGKAHQAPGQVGPTIGDEVPVALKGATGPNPVDGYKVGDTIDVPGLGSGSISRISVRDKLGRIHIEVPLQYGIADADAIVPVDPAGNICTDQVWWSDDEPERTSRIAWPDPVLTPAPAKNSRKGKTDAA